MKTKSLRLKSGGKMILSIKDIIKLFSIIIVSFCAVMVCTFFLNFYIDALSIENQVYEPLRALYDAQLSMAKFTSIITGGCLSIISIIMLLFYIKLYIDNHLPQIGILKAFGYPNGKIAMRFWPFGISIFIGNFLGHLVGYALMPIIYEGMSIEGNPTIDIHYHFLLTILLVILPTLFFSLLACFYANIVLKRPTIEMLKNRSKEKKPKHSKKEKEETYFLKAMAISTIKRKPSIAFFFAFACFCFSSMIQMSFSMQTLTEGTTMWEMILGIGLVLAFVTTMMALTTLINQNKKNVAMMRTFGYQNVECMLSIFLGYVPFALLGFLIGTVYQFGLLSLMVNVFFKDVGDIIEYSFNVPVFLYTFLAFILSYGCLFFILNGRLKKVSVKEIMLDE